MKTQTKKITERLLGSCLALILLFSLIPIAAFAEENTFEQAQSETQAYEEISPEEKAPKEDEPKEALAGTSQEKIKEGFYEEELVAQEVLGVSALSSAQTAAPASSGKVSVDTIVDLQTAVANSTENRTISLTSSFKEALANSNASVSLTNSNGYAVAIDGSNMTLTQVLNTTGCTFKITSTSGSITLLNMTLSGYRAGIETSSTHGNGRVELNNVVIEGSTKNPALKAGAGQTTVTNSLFKNTKQGGILVAGSAPSNAACLEIDNTLFQSNVGGAGAALMMGSNSTVTAKNSSFIDNKATAAGYSGGAISFDQSNEAHLELHNCYLKGNVSPPANTGANTGGRGGAIGVHLSNKSSLTVKNSFFEANMSANGTAGITNDGGAISVYQANWQKSFSATIEGCTFSENIANDDGGALHLEGHSFLSASSVIVRNSTFYANKGLELAQAVNSGGGAIQIYNKIATTIEGCSFYKNEVHYGLGAGLAAFSPSTLKVSDCAFINNTAQDGSSNYNNFYRNGGAVPTLAHNVGLDNGAALPLPQSDMILAALGTSEATLQTNGSAIEAGDAMYKRAVPTILIGPRLSNEAYASAIYPDASGAGSTMQDQRGFPRTAPSDVGAVELAWAKFYPNGVPWNSAEIGDYNNTRMLTHVEDSSNANNGTALYIASTPNASIVLPSEPFFDMSAQSSPGQTFLGWGERPDTEQGESDFYAPGTRVRAHEGAGVAAYYAVWEQPQQHTVLYKGNEHTRGSEPTDTASPYTAGSKVSVLEKGDLAKDGYTFTGWNTSAEGKGTAYAPGDTFVIEASIILYAQWSKNQIVAPVDPNPNPNPSPGTETRPLVPANPETLAKVNAGAESLSQKKLSAEGASEEEREETERAANSFENENVPLGTLAGREGWSLISLVTAILALLGTLVGAITIIGARKKRAEQENQMNEDTHVEHKEETAFKQGRTPLYIASALGLVPFILFLLLEDFTQMILVNTWTPLIVTVFLVHLVILIAALILKKRKTQALTGSSMN